MSKPEQISLNEVTFRSPYLADITGRLFTWRGRIYRAITPEKREFVLSMFEKKGIESLFDKGLVRTQIAPLALEGYGLVLEHERIPFTTYCMEWPSEMLRDAALLMCDLGAELNARGLNLYDAHPWNVLFDRGNPVFVDWGSIVPADRDFEWPYMEFRAWFILPQLLMAAGLGHLARVLFFDLARRPAARDVIPLLLGRLPSSFLASWMWRDRQLKHLSIGHSPAIFFRKLRESIDAIPSPRTGTEWSTYEGVDQHYRHDAPEQWHIKIRNVDTLIARHRPQTVLDIGCNRGWFSELATRHGASVIAADLDEPSLNTLYRRVHDSRLPIWPTLLDITSPTPSYCLAYPAAEERLRADFVLALALTHHLVFKRRLTFQAIAKQLAVLTKKQLIVEFVPPDDMHVREWMTNQYSSYHSDSWYHLDGFVQALQPHFKRVEVLDSFPPPRKLLCCER